MKFLNILIFLIVLIALIEAQKGGTKTRPKSPQQPRPPRPQPPTKSITPKRPAPAQRPVEPDNEDDSGSAGNSIDENAESGPEPPAVVPQTSFTCDNKPYSNFGMFADEEVDCSVYHMCVEGRKESFLCGTGTMFNQEILSCDHPAKVNCANSQMYWSANEDLGKPGAEPSPGQNQTPVSPSKQPSQSGSKGSAISPPPRQTPRPRVQQPKTKTSQPRATPAPRPAPKPFEDDENDNEQEEPARQPIPQPKSRPSKTKPRAKTPIVQSYLDNESESNVRRAYRARY